MTEDTGRISPDGRWRWDGSRWQPATPSIPPAAARERTPSWLEQVVASLGDVRIEQPADWRVLAAVAVVAVASDVAFRAPRVGLAATLLVLVTAAALVASRRVGSRHELVLLAVAVVLAGGLTLRDSPWVVLPDAITVTALLVSACGMPRDRSLLDLSFAVALERWARAVVQIGAGPLFIAGYIAQARRRLSGEHRSHTVAVARGLALAVPVVIVVAGLLAQADAVFASFFEVHGDLGDLALHAAGLALGAGAMAGLCRTASAAPARQAPPVAWRLGRVEGLVVLGALDLVFAAFTGAQVLAATGAGANAIREHGLTYAEYARSGFFQLLWVAGITLVLLLVLRTVVDRGHPAAGRSFLLFAELAVAFTLVIVVVAFQRLSLYEGVYGLTMLRLYSQVFAGWIAVVYLALAVALTPLWRGRRWLLGVVVASGVVGLLGLNIADPEQLVVRFDTAQAPATHRLDVRYLSSLSDDAVPSLVAAMPGLDAAARGTARDHLCAGSAPVVGWSGYNVSAAAADRARRIVCG